MLEVGADGTTANVVVLSFGSVRFNVADANEWGEIPMFSCDYELKFSFGNAQWEWLVLVIRG